MRKVLFIKVPKSYDNGRSIDDTDDTQNYPFFKFKLEVATFKHSTYLSNNSKFIQVPKVVKPTNKKATS